MNLSTQAMDDVLHWSGRVQDPLHGVIGLTEEEQRAIDLPQFQRLRKLNQLGFTSHVYPGATHTRFEHSLGVMHLADLFFMNLLSNQESLLRKYRSSPEIERTVPCLAFLKQNQNYIRRTIRFAGLLHDVGHGPFSHVSERFMPTYGSFLAAIEQEQNAPDNSIASNKLMATTDDCGIVFAAIADKAKNLSLKFGNDAGLEKRVRHEIYTLMVACEMLCVDNGFDPEFRNDVLALLDSDVLPGPNSLFRQAEGTQVLPLLCSLVSGELDADRLDYLQRDAFHAGVVYGRVDQARLLSSILFYVDEKKAECRPAIKQSGMPDFEHFLMGRWAMYKQVYLHKTSTAADAMLQYIREAFDQAAKEGKEALRFPLNTADFISIDDQNFLTFLKKEASRIGLRKEVRQVIEDVVDRKLWERRYEENSMEDAGLDETAFFTVIERLRNEKTAHISMESSAILTSMSGDRRRRNTGGLHTISRVLDPTGEETNVVVPFHKHSQVILRTENRIVFRRVYATRKSRPANKTTSPFPNDTENVRVGEND